MLYFSALDHEHKCCILYTKKMLTSNHHEWHISFHIGLVVVLH